MRMASRYFATVRRAMSTPVSFRISTIRSSECTSASAFSASISCLILCRTLSAEWASPPEEEAIEEVKKNFISNSPRGVAIIVEAEHMCVSMRGVQKQGASTITTQFTGVFRDDPAEQARFLTLVRGLR